MRITNKEQFEFFRLSAIFLNYVVYYCMKNGMVATWGDAYRDKRCPYGSERSRHHDRLAIDINLIKDGQLIHDDTGHKDLGQFWLGLDKDCSWGGSFNDFNHYSYLE